jgi:hypothetical protein
MDAETHNIPPGEYKQEMFFTNKRSFSVGIGGWKAEACHHQEYCSYIICGDCI